MSERKPKLAIYWAASCGGCEIAVLGLQEKLLNLGFLKEKRGFKPHLTLGRVRSARNRQQLKQPLTSLTPAQISMQAERLTLFQSTLSKAGAIYQPLHTAGLSSP